MTFRVGQKVVCVDISADQPNRGRTSDHLKLREVYTVREVCEFAYLPDRELGPAIRLVEVFRNPSRVRTEYSDYPFRASRFRPVVDRPTDISIFTKMLTPKGVEA